MIGKNNPITEPSPDFPYYDTVGNITEIKTASGSNLNSKTEYRSYDYDSKNQLLRENNKSSNKTVVYKTGDGSMSYDKEP